MKLEHIAVWTYQIEALKAFYEKYFEAKASEKYVNEKKKFHSYFLSFDGGARLEIMEMEGVPVSENDIYKQFTGLIHMAFELESQSAVDLLTERLHQDGFEVVGQPRITGDGYYESVILDPDGNRLEITFNLN
ncbi:VOC family protein [Chondrinema litorale]|uniref:VOC family protein n=1 Tax=Chondrinema litorale TaxID=2994555 RepID=UPI002543C569|nr:VOC family protein [Chondrinema litorale]UZR99314.1 VOC family protein [Chondrinema litorale]